MAWCWPQPGQPVYHAELEAGARLNLLNGHPSSGRLDPEAFFGFPGIVFLTIGFLASFNGIAGLSMSPPSAKNLPHTYGGDHILRFLGS
jgi:hypothetical protein